MRFAASVMIAAIGLCSSFALAQTPGASGSGQGGSSGPVDLKALPAEIKNLNWKSVDFSALAPVDRVRALMLMNDVFDEISAQLTTEADLQSAFIENTNQGAKFVAFQPTIEAAPLTLAQAQQIAAAMLKGPMASSAYASRLGDSAKDVLGAYEQMYSSTVNRKWAAIADTRMRVRAMSQFLASTKQMDAYKAFVPGEVKLLAEQQQALQAQQSAAAAQKQAEQAEKQAAARERQAAQQQQQAQAALQMQQAMQAAQAQQQPQLTKGELAQQQANENAAAEAGGAAYPYGYGYPYGYYGGAYAWNAARAAGADYWWNHHNYQGAAMARTDARFNGWHGGGFRR